MAMAKIKTCPGCGRAGVDRWAILPKGDGVVCQPCFKKATGHTALPSSGPLSMLAYHSGQFLYDSPGDDTLTPRADVGPARKTIGSQTLGAQTLGSLTVTVLTINRVTVRTVTINRAGNPILGR